MFLYFKNVNLKNVYLKNVFRNSQTKSLSSGDAIRVFNMRIFGNNLYNTSCFCMIALSRYTIAGLEICAFLSYY